MCKMSKLLYIKRELPILLFAIVTNFTVKQMLWNIQFNDVNCIWPLIVLVSIPLIYICLWCKIVKVMKNDGASGNANENQTINGKQIVVHVYFACLHGLSLKLILLCGGAHTLAPYLSLSTLNWI